MIIVIKYCVLFTQSSDMIEQLHAFIFTEAISASFGAKPRPRVIVLDILSEQFHAVMWPDNSTADPVSAASLKSIIENLKNDELPFIQFEL